MLLLGFVEWMNSNSGALSVLTNGGMLIVWIVYAQLLLRSYRRRRRPRMAISSSSSKQEGGRIIACNLAANSIFVECIMLCLTYEDDQKRRRFLDESVMGETARDGPVGALKSGHSFDLGTIKDLIESSFGRAKDQNGHFLEGTKAIQVVVIGFYAENKMPFAAGRHFDIECEGEHMKLHTDSVFTDHWTSKRERYEACEWLKEYYGARRNRSED
ncbi:MAG: hypothetical protein E1N59_511 [Puniceicoccaceae bacterium 5H]|nr:MAG: hypothetical protein E1N59_511 [Puniceicoccaceae bacterium 5H]